MRGSSLIWRALETARRSNLKAAGDAAPVQGAPGMSRRALLGALAAAGVAPALPRPAQAFAGGRVAIVGGGIAGLAALHYLTEAGIDARLYEARNRLGGRMYTQRLENGAAFEVGGQLVNSNHEDIRALAQAFGVALIDRKAEPHRSLVFADGRVLTEHDLAEGLRGIAEQIAGDSARLDSDYARYGPPLDRMSVRAYLDRHAAMLPAPWVRRLLEAGVRTEYGVEMDKASALELVFNLPTVDGEKVEVLGDSDEHYVLSGGSGTLAEAVAARHAARIQTGRRLLRIEAMRGGVRLGFLDGATAEAETVIVAVPMPILRQIDFRVPLPAAWRGYIRDVEMGRNEKVQASASATAWRAPMGAGGEFWQLDGHDYSLGWEGSVHAAPEPRPTWTWYLSGDEVDADKPPHMLAPLFATEAEAALPGIAAATAAGPFRRAGWCRDPLTLGSYINYAPGQLTRYGHLLWVESEDPAERQSARAGRIIFAGEHLSDAWPAFMNGGAQTGRLAAEALIGRAVLAPASLKAA